MQELMTFRISQICVTQPVVPEYSICTAQLFLKKKVSKRSKQ